MKDPRNSCSTRNTKKAVITLLALALLFVAHQVFIRAIQSTSLYEWQSKYLHWRYMHQAVFFFVVPLLALVVLRRKPSAYALSWNRHVLASISTIIALTLLLPILVDLCVGQLRPVRASAAYLLSTLVFQVIFSGCGEELCFRGMYQGEIDRALGKRFRIGATRFGPGLFIAALLFGVGHLGISGSLDGAPLHLKAFVATSLIGLFLGFVREYVGCIFIVGFLHASFDTYSCLVQPSLPGRIVHFIAIGIACYLLFSRRLHVGERIAEPEADASP